MSAAVTAKDAQDLRKLIPLNILSASRFESLCSEVGIEEATRGSLLFSQGDAKNELVYVLSGTVSLQAGGMEMETISAGTESARFALAHQIPRKVSAVAKDRVRYIRVDPAYVNQPNESAVSGVATYEVSDIPEDSYGDWVTTLLKSPIFQRLPPANLQNLLSILEEIPVTVGQEIIRQDEPGDYYYVIKQGRCALTRKPSKHAREIKLAELKTCDTFGEDSLISGEPRNVTVTMLSDGVLLRLNKEDFLRLVKEPVIAHVNMENAQRMIAQGGVWVDVRTPDAFDEGHLPGAVNIPFFKLRMELNNLNRQHKYILVCETGRVSESAAFLLIRHLFDAYVLKGGVSAVFRDQLVLGADSGPSGDENPGGDFAVEERVEPPQASGRRTDGAPELASREEQLVQTHVAREALEKEIRTLKTELAAAHAEISDLQTQVKERQGIEEQVREQSLALTEELARLKDVQADMLTGQAFQTMERRCAELEAGRQALESDLQTALVDKAELERQLQALRAASAVEKHSANSREALQKEIRGLEELNSSNEQERRLAEARIQELEQQVAELSAVVQEFVDRQSPVDGDELQSLNAELETVRAQAAGDVMAVQAKLRGAEQEVARLRSALESAHEQLLGLETEQQAGLKSGRHRTGFGKALFGKLVYSLLMAAIGAALLIAVTAGTAAGRGLTQKLLASFGQEAPSSPGS